MAEVQRRSTNDFGAESRNRRKSGIFFFNRSFKKPTSAPKEEPDSNASAPATPTTPTLGPAPDGPDLKRSDSGRSIPALAQTSEVTVEAERALSSSPKTASASLGEAAKKSTTEDLPTPPDTPGHSGTNGGGPETQELPVVQEKSYHEDADLHIKVRESNGIDGIYSVRSCVLESASRVWRQSIPSHTSDSVEMVSDPAFGLDVIFSIAHYRFQDLPQQVDATKLYEIALTAEKYETMHLLLPFLKGWVASLPGSSGPAEPGTSEVEALVLGWILGNAQLFSRAISHCAYNSSISADGTLLDPQGRAWRDQLVGGEVVELLAAVRLGAVEKIVEAVSGPVNILLNPHSHLGGETRFCQAPGDDSVREECEQLQLGSAIMSLSKAKLWPPPAASQVQVSPAELARTYADVRLRRSVEDVHAQCGFGHQDQFAKILGQQAQLTSVVIEQLAARAKRSGVYEEAAFADLQATLVKPET